MPPGAIPHWCDYTVPPQPEGPGMRSGSEGHRRGCSITSPLALPCYSAVTGHAVAPSQPRCTMPDEETVQDGCQRQPTLHRGGKQGALAVRSPPPCRASCSAGTPRHGTPVMPAGDQCVPPWLCPGGTSQCEPAGLCAGIQTWPRIPGHDHASLGTAMRPWGCNKHGSGHRGGYHSIPLLSPRIPRQGRTCRACPRLEGSVLGLQPGHRIRATTVTEGLCQSVTRRVRVLGLLPHHRDSRPSPALTLASQQLWAGGRGSGPPSLTGGRSRAGGGADNGATLDPWHFCLGLGWGCHGPSRTQPHIPKHP